MGPTRSSASRELAEGVAMGALFMAFFGAIWAAAGASALDGATGVVLLIVSVALAAVLCLGAVRLRRSARGLSRDDSPQAREQQKHVSRRFNLVFGLQGIAIALAVVLLGRYGLGSFIPAAVALIVGVHFFPLARLYGVRVYHVTGAVMCVIALVALLLAPASRLPFVGLGSATTLFVTSAYVLLFLGGKVMRSSPPTA